MFLPGFCLSTSTYLLGFLHTGDNEIVEVLEGFDTRKILSGYVETEVLDVYKRQKCICASHDSSIQ